MYVNIANLETTEPTGNLIEIAVPGVENNVAVRELKTAVELSDGARITVPLPQCLHVIPSGQVRGYHLMPSSQVTNIFGNTPEKLSDVWDCLVIVDDPESHNHGVVCYDYDRQRKINANNSEVAKENRHTDPRMSASAPESTC